MKKISLIIIAILVFNCLSISQVTIAKLKFEDAETAYNAGEYAKTLSRLADAEKIFGKINSPILHLRILAQNKLYQQTRDDQLGFELKKNCAFFLKEYADIEALEDKYKEVYRINEDILDIPGSIEELNLIKEKKNKAYQEGKNKYFEIIENYINAIGGKNNLLKVKSIEIYEEMDPIDYLEIDGIKYYKNKIKSTQKIIDKEIFFLEQKGQKGMADATYISMPGKMEWKVGKNKYAGDNIQADIWNENLYIFPELNTIPETDSLFVQEGNLDGLEVNVLTRKSKLYTTITVFNSKTGLKVSENKVGYLSNSIIQESETQFISYKEIEGIKFPELYKQKSIQKSAIDQSQKNQFDIINKAIINKWRGQGVKTLSQTLIDSNLKSLDNLKIRTIKQSYTVKLISLKLNPEFRDKDLE